MTVEDIAFAGIVVFNCICALMNAHFAQRNFDNARINTELARSLSETAAKFGYVVLAKNSR
jgi:hypothetical protein